jgi:soluble lytic murein transglycosylase-like protein
MNAGRPTGNVPCGATVLPTVLRWVAAGLLAHAVLATAQTAPEPGEPERLTALGKFFEQAEPPSQDLGKARDLYCRAAAHGQPEALRRLGWLYFKGLGVAVSEATAGTLFRWSAELGDADAAGLALAVKSATDAPPPCLAQRGLHSVDAVREKRMTRKGPTSSVAPLADKPETRRPIPATTEQRRLVQLVVNEARQFRIDPRLVLAVMRVESGFDSAARSTKNAQGLMQLIPETAARFNVTDPFDPVENIRGGMAYLRWLLAYYRGDVPMVLAAYNAGEGAVDRHRGVPPFSETIAYVQRIRALYPFDRHPFDRGVLAGEPGSWVTRDVAAR